MHFDRKEDEKVIMGKKDENNLLEDVLKKISYSTGFTWKKVNKLKNKTINLFQNAKVDTADMINSFKDGFESIEGQIGNDAVRGAENELKGNKCEPKESQGIKMPPEELLNSGFEKEIEEIDKEMAEI